MVILENIDIDIDTDKAILQNIDIDKISNRFKFGISNRARDCTAIQCILVVIVFLGGLVGIFQWTHRFCNSEFRCKIELLVSYTDIVD